MVGVAGEERGTIRRPGEGGALRSLALAGHNLRLQLINQVLVLQVPDLDGGAGGNAEPVLVWREAERVDDVVVVKGVQVLALGQIPEHGLKVLATRGAQRAVRGHGDGVQVASVTNVVGLQLAVGKVPHLKCTQKQH